MTFREAFLKMIDGKKIRCVDWSKEKYWLFVKEFNDIYDETNCPIFDRGDKWAASFYDILWYVIFGEVINKEWELYKEPTEYFGWQKAYELLKQGKKLCFKGMEDSISYVRLFMNILIAVYCSKLNEDYEREMVYIDGNISIFTEEPLMIKLLFTIIFPIILVIIICYLAELMRALL